MSLARFEPTPGNQTWKLRVAPRERPTISAGMDGSVTPKSLQAAIGLCHMGRSATPTEEIQMMQQHEMYGQEEYGDEMDPNQMVEDQDGGDGSNALVSN